MSLKPGVKLAGISPELAFVMPIVAEVFRSLGYAWTVTSAKDGTHKAGSLHYSGRAIDLRTRHLPPDDRGKLRAALKQRLGTEFDVVLETDHLHVEHDPK